MSLAHLIHSVAARDPDRTAVLGEDAAISYRALAEEVDAAGALLLSHRVQAGETVAFALSQAPYWQWVLMLGALRIGAVPTLLGGHPLREIQALGQAHVVCAEGADLTRVAGLNTIGLAPQTLSALRKTRKVIGLPAPADADATAGGLLAGRLDRPRAVRLDAGALQARLQATARAHGFEEHSRVLCLFGAGVSHLTECVLAIFAAGATLVLPARPERGAAMMVQARVDRLVVMPEVLRALLKIGRPLGDVASRRLSLVTGPLLRPLVPAVTQLVAADARQVAWSPESGVFALLSGAEVPAAGGWLGRALEGVELNVEAPESQPAPGEGLVRVRTPWMAAGYVDGKPAEGPRGLAGGWHHTALVGGERADGLWWVKGSSVPRRASAPSAPLPATTASWSRGALEQALCKLPGVSEACVLSQPVPGTTGVPVIAYVGTTAAADLNPAVQGLLGADARFHVVRVPRTPRLPDGAVDRSALARVLERELAAAAARQQPARQAQEAATPGGAA